jgi:hypothetical protein
MRKSSALINLLIKALLFLLSQRAHVMFARHAPRVFFIFCIFDSYIHHTLGAAVDLAGNKIILWCIKEKCIVHQPEKAKDTVSLARCWRKRFACARGYQPADGRQGGGRRGECLLQRPPSVNRPTQTAPPTECTLPELRFSKPLQR